jgi:hypothetical protein
MRNSIVALIRSGNLQTNVFNLDHFRGYTAGPVAARVEWGYRSFTFSKRSMRRGLYHRSHL